MKHAILIVDDDEDMLDWLERVLGPVFDVTRAESGEEALELLQRQRYAALVCDDLMPGMRGIEVCARARAADPRLACVLLSGLSDQMRDAAADRVLLKPVDTGALRHAIEAAIVAKSTVQR